MNVSILCKKNHPRRKRKGTVLLIQISLRIRIHLLIWISVEKESQKKRHEIKNKMINQFFITIRREIQVDDGNF